MFLDNIYFLYENQLKSLKGINLVFAFITYHFFISLFESNLIIEFIFLSIFMPQICLICDKYSFVNLVTLLSDITSKVNS